MSHELRTPLNAIMGFSGILAEGMAGDLPPTVHNMVGNIYRSAEHLLSLINDILDLSKIEAGRFDLVIAPINVPDMLKDWRNHVSVLADKKGLQFEINAKPLPQSISGDKGRISQIVINLLSNAIKFTDVGKVELGVEWAETGLILKVIDSGVGIPPEALNYIFDEFRQVDGTTQRRHEGTGLGLAIVRKLCWLMGGDVQVTSRLGEGSIFTVRLPLQPLAEPMSMN